MTAAVSGEDDNETEDDELLIGLIGLAKYTPVLMSELKFAAHGKKFLFNYIKNLPHYVLRLNERLNDSSTPTKNQEQYRGLLAKIDIHHIAIVYHLHDVIDVLSKAQHGVSKVNQLPWHYNDRLDHLKADLSAVMKEDYEGPNKAAKSKLKQGEFETGTLIATEERRRTRVTVESSNEESRSKARTTVSQFVEEMKSEIDRRISIDHKVELMRKVFKDFDPIALAELLEIAVSSGKEYGSLDNLSSQLEVLKQRYTDQLLAKDEMSKWLMICTKQQLYKDIPDILHFALCCFVKVPLEAPAETIGSLINQHGRKDRCSLSPASLSSEVQVAWNGPAEYDPNTEQLIDRALKDYFEEHTQKGTPRFFITSGIRHSSSTVATYMNKSSRIKFNF